MNIQQSHVSKLAAELVSAASPGALPGGAEPRTVVILVQSQDGGTGSMMRTDRSALPLLTRNEYETLKDMACGLTDKAIADKRSLSVRGVQNRVTSIFQKVLGAEQELGTTGVLNLRVKAVCEAVRIGLIDLSSVNS